eukprot:CAMPEP_0182854756 /NCGR_PEP_ID=MMETSP0034_2-20130328/1446_1 /TAXON_ID=156128 /ORGANISM="Nephroselmis pyriformis, Strain CCMP717" /LENGTH=1923 /DNA_ID=CAMNT_0024985631 /DNA_START=60 /DNA_END=5827 /DNA_ORIENTATION=+
MPSAWAIQHTVCFVVPVGKPYDQILAGALLAVDDINARDGRFVGGALADLPEDFSIHAVVRDSLLDVNIAIQHFWDCIQVHNVHGVVGDVLGEITVPLAYATAAAGMPHVSYATSSLELSDSVRFPGFFRSVPTDDVLPRAVVTLAAEFGWRRLGILFPTDSWGRGFADRAVEAAEGLGGKGEVHEFGYKEGEEGAFDTAMGAILNSGVKIIIGLFYPHETAAFARAAGQAGVLGRGWAWILGSGLSPSALAELGREEAPGGEALSELLTGFISLEAEIMGDAAYERLEAVWATEGAAVHARWLDAYPALAGGGESPFAAPPSREVARGYDAMWAMALGLAHVFAGNVTSTIGNRGGREVLAALVGGFGRGPTGGAAFEGMGGAFRLAPCGDVAPESLFFRLNNVRKKAGGGAEVVQLARYQIGAPLDLDSLPEFPGAEEPPPDGLDCGPRTSLYLGTLKCGYKVGFLFPYRISDYWRRVTAAAYLAVEHINTRNSTIVPQAASLPEGFSLLPFLFDTRFTSSGGILAFTEAAREDVAALVGGARSAVNANVASLAGEAELPQVSYWSTSSALTSTSLFPTFSRTIPTDEALTEFYVAAFKFWNWTRVAVLYTADEWGAAFYQNVRDRGREQTPPIEVSPFRFDYGSDRSIKTALAGIKRDEFYVVLSLVFAPDVPSVFFNAEDMGLLRSGRAWVSGDIAIEEAVDNLEAAGDAPGAARLRRNLAGSVRIGSIGSAAPGWEGLVRAYKEGAEAATREVVQELEFARLGTALTNEDIAAFSYDAVWSIALSLAAVEAASPAPADRAATAARGGDVHRALLGIEFEGSSGTVKFTPDGDRNLDGVQVQILNYALSEDGSELVMEAAMRGGITTGIVPDKPIVWHGGYTGVPKDGGGCAAGRYFAESSLDCELCPPGTFAAVTGGQGVGSCIPCYPGAVCGASGCKQCGGCERGSFPARNGTTMPRLSGGTHCKLCPAGTTTWTSPATGPEECECSRGFYRRDGMPGRECFPCPKGAVCDGADARPYAQMGYWGDWELVDTNVTDSYSLATDLSKIAFQECRTGTCDGDCGLGPSALEETESARRAIRQCRSQPDKSCSGTNRGPLCGRCAHGYFSLGGRCTKCRKPAWLFVGGCLLLILLGWIAINAYASNTFDALDIMLLYLQVASMISSFNLGWHDLLINRVWSIISIVNFDIDFFSPECLASSPSSETWSYWHGFVLQLLLLPLVVLFTALYLGMLRLWHKGTQHAWWARNAVADGSRENPVGEFSVLGARAPRVARAKTKRSLTSRRGFQGEPEESRAEKQEQRFRDAVSASISRVGMFANTVYHTVTIRAASVYFCTELPGGRQVLTASPDINCWEGGHIAGAAAGALCLLVYTIGIPVVFLSVLRYAAAHDILKDQEFASRFGWMYARYENEFYWWELMLLLRRGLFSLVVVILRRFPLIQAAVGVGVLSLALCAHFYARPFLETRIDFLDTFSLWSLQAVICCGVLFYDASITNLVPDFRGILLVVALVLIFVCAAVVVVIVAQDFRDLAARAYLERVFSHPAIIGRHGNGDMELINTLDPHALRKWVKALSKGRPSGTEEGGAPPHRRRRRSTGSTRTMDTADPIQVARIADVNNWTRDCLKDDSDMSYYSRDYKALFYSRLLRSNPTLVDYLAYCPPEEQVSALVVFRRMLKMDLSLQTMRASDPTKPVVPLCELVHPMDRAGLAYWFLHADPEHVIDARKLLESIRDAQYGFHGNLALAKVNTQSIPEHHVGDDFFDFLSGAPKNRRGSRGDEDAEDQSATLSEGEVAGADKAEGALSDKAEGALSLGGGAGLVAAAAADALGTGAPGPGANVGGAGAARESLERKGSTAETSFRYRDQKGLNNRQELGKQQSTFMSRLSEAQKSRMKEGTFNYAGRRSSSDIKLGRRSDASSEG